MNHPLRKVISATAEEVLSRDIKVPIMRRADFLAVQTAEKKAPSVDSLPKEIFHDSHLPPDTTPRKNPLTAWQNEGMQTKKMDETLAEPLRNDTHAVNLMRNDWHHFDMDFEIPSSAPSSGKVLVNLALGGVGGVNKPTRVYKPLTKGTEKTLTGIMEEVKIRAPLQAYPRARVDKKNGLFSLWAWVVKSFRLFDLQQTSSARVRKAANVSRPPQRGSKTGEWMVWACLVAGIVIGFIGTSRYFDNDRQDQAVNALLAQSNRGNEGAHTQTASLSTTAITISAANASVGARADKTINGASYQAVFPYSWQRFIDKLEIKRYKIMLSQELHPRLYMLQIARGVELNLLLSENEKVIEEVSVRVHTLDAVDPLPTYRQLVADMQDILADGVTGGDKQFFAQLNLPTNLHSVALPYSVQAVKGPITAELQIFDPIYLNLRWRPNKSAATAPK